MARAKLALAMDHPDGTPSTERAHPESRSANLVAEFPADLLFGCVEIGGTLVCDPDRLVFTPGEEREPTEIAFEEITQMRLGGRQGADANRIDLTLLDGRRVTFLVVGRDRISDLILSQRGWDAESPEFETVERLEAGSRDGGSGV